MACTQGMLTVCVFLPLVACCFIYTRNENYISCDSTFCDFGEEAFVTCTFHENIKESKMDVSVERFIDGNDLGTNVLTCTWKQDEIFDCKTEPEYTLEKIIANTLTLRIPNAKKAVVGTYKCQVVPPDGTIPHVCNFTGSDDHPSLCVFLVVLALIEFIAIIEVICIWYSERSRTTTILEDDSEKRPLLEVVSDRPLTPQQNVITPEEVESRDIFELSASEVLIDHPEKPPQLEVVSGQPLNPQQNISTPNEEESRAILSYERSVSEVLIDTARDRYMPSGKNIIARCYF